MTDAEPDGDVLRQRVFRALLYGAPFVSAALMLTTVQLLAEFAVDRKWTFVAGCGFALVAALGSAAGALGLRNRLAWRVTHAIAAAVVSVAVYATAVAAFVALLTVSSL